MLHALVHANRSVENDAFTCIFRSSLKRYPAKSNGACGCKGAFWVDAVQNRAKSITFLANQIAFWNGKVVDEQFIGVHRLSAELFDFDHVDIAAV